MRERTAHRLRLLLVLLLPAHLAFSIARLPHAAYAKRLRHLGEWERLGPIGFHVGRTWPEAARTLSWLAQHAPEDAVVLYEGHWKGLLEFVPALLRPRLVYAAAAVAPGATRVGDRPIAGGTLPNGQTGTWVLKARDKKLWLEVR